MLELYSLRFLYASKSLASTAIPATGSNPLDCFALLAMTANRFMQQIAVIASEAKQSRGFQRFYGGLHR